EAAVALMNTRLSGRATALRAPRIADGTRTADRMDSPVSSAPHPEDAVGEPIDEAPGTGWLQDAPDVLHERELSIIRERRLCDDGATLEALGEKLGISKERVRQIEGRALEKLRSALLRSNPELAAHQA